MFSLLHMPATKRSNYVEVGQRLEQARLMRDAERPDGSYSKSAVAAAGGMSPSAYTQWINGTTKSYDAEKMIRVAEHLRVRVPWLLFGESPMEDGEIERAAAELLQQGPADIVSESLNFMGYHLSRSIADDPAKLGRYLKMIDEIIRSRKP